MVASPPSARSPEPQRRKHHRHCKVSQHTTCLLLLSCLSSGDWGPEFACHRWGHMIIPCNNSTLYCLQHEYAMYTSLTKSRPYLFTYSQNILLTSVGLSPKDKDCRLSHLPLIPFSPIAPGGPLRPGSPRDPACPGKPFSPGGPGTPGGPGRPGRPGAPNSGLRRLAASWASCSVKFKELGDEWQNWGCCELLLFVRVHIITKQSGLSSFSCQTASWLPAIVNIYEDFLLRNYNTTFSVF